jgi:hypothetical protein
MRRSKMKVIDGRSTTLDGYSYKILKASFIAGLPSIKGRIYIQYDDDGEITTCSASSRYECKFSRHPKCYGIGINDSTKDSNPTIVEKWRGAIRRATQVERGYSCTRSDSTIDSYTGVEVCKEWLRYSNFERWAIPNFKEGFDLDKDLLGDGKLYSPDTCCFIPHLLNSNLSLQKKGISSLFGVAFDKKKQKYYSRKYLRGRSSKKKFFNSEIEAHHYWQLIKAETLKELAIEYFSSNQISENVYQKVLEKSEKLLTDNRLGLITHSI